MPDIEKNRQNICQRSAINRVSRINDIYKCKTFSLNKKGQELI